MSDIREERFGMVLEAYVRKLKAVKTNDLRELTLLAKEYPELFDPEAEVELKKIIALLNGHEINNKVVKLATFKKKKSKKPKK